MLTATLALTLVTLQAPYAGKVHEAKIPDTVISFKLTQIPAGTIKIGDKEHAIKPIYVAQTEVTWEAYDIWMLRLDLPWDPSMAKTMPRHLLEYESRPSYPYGAPDRGFGHNGYAALGMTFPCAKFYCEWLTKKLGKTFRLPTEAEWEYAARAGAAAEPEKLDDVAWFWDNSEDKTMPVGKKKPNAWGLYDMLGNTAEWVVMPDGEGVVAGGSYMDKREKVTYAARQKYSIDWQMRDPQIPKSAWWLSDGPFVGMRVVMEP